MNCSSIKPLDSDTIIVVADRTKTIITCEDHQVSGGLGSAIAELLLKNQIHIPIEMIGVENSFGESGSWEELKIKYHLSAKDIAQKAFNLYKKKIEK